MRCEVHARDVQEKLISAKCESPYHFLWMSQLRFELREPGDGGEGGSSNMMCYVLPIPATHNRDNVYL